MCGIAGIVRLSGRRDDPIERLTEALRHRGPDDHGYYRDDCACLGHRRLSIIDLSAAGRQPLGNEDGTVQLVFNGEIYDYQPLRQALEAEGHRFRSNTDSEVLVHLYERDAERLVEHIDGMFAMAIWDRPRRRLLLARDHMGKKPLYYYPFPDGLLFASELKAILEHPLVQRRIAPEALHAYLLLGYLPGELSIVEGVRRLPPGHTLTFGPAGLRLAAYFTPEVTPAPDGAAAPATPPPQAPATRRRATAQPGEVEDQALDLLRRAVRRRLVADVEVGVFLSGGIDSSLVTALAVEAQPRVKTFSIGFAEAAFDESPHAQRVARALGTEHVTEVCDAGSLVRVLPEVLSVFDEPFADASALPTFILARMTARQVKVALGGDGGDELFGGYPTLRAQRWAAVMNRIPAVGAMLRCASRWIAEGEGYYPFGYVLRRFATGLPLTPWERQLSWTAYLPPADLPRLCSGLSGWPDTVAALGRSCASRHGVEGTSHNLDQRLYLPDDILVKTDRASMGHSLEVRAPFLDRRLVHFANHLPLAWTRDKVVLRRLLKRTPVGFIATRKKQGFAVPVAAWLRGELRGWATERLPQAARLGLSATAVQQLWDEHLTGRRNRWRELWAVLVLCEWSARWRATL